MAGWQVLRWPATWCAQTAYALVHFVVIQPLGALYLQGPLALGFWGGMPAPHICAQMAPQTTSEHWGSTPANRAACRAMIEREFWSWLVLAYVVARYVMLLGGGWWALRRMRQRLRPSGNPPTPSSVIVTVREK